MVYNSRPFAFIESFQQPFPEDSVEIITKEFRIILQKRWQEKCSFLKTSAEGQMDNDGEAWDNAKKLIEQGEYEGLENSELTY